MFAAVYHCANACVYVCACMQGVKRDKLRWKKCVEYANDQMGLAVGAMFVRENFRWQSKQTVSKVNGTMGKEQKWGRKKSRERFLCQEC